MKLFLQLTFIFLAFGFIALMLGLRFAPPNNALDRLLRPTLIRSSLTSRLFQLDQVGDARYQLSTTQTPLAINVWHEAKTIPNPELSRWLEDTIKQTVDRSTIITFHPLKQPIPASVSDAELNEILKTLPLKKSSTINIIYLPQSQSAPTNAGQAINATTMLMFTQTISSLSERAHIRDLIEQSTLMHEWGHLLGLDHINQEACIMNERVEVYGNRRFQGTNLPTAYCPEELYQLKVLTR